MPLRLLGLFEYPLRRSLVGCFRDFARCGLPCGNPWAPLGPCCLPLVRTTARRLPLLMFTTSFLSGVGCVMLTRLGLLHRPCAPARLFCASAGVWNAFTRTPAALSLFGTIRTISTDFSQGCSESSTRISLSAFLLFVSFRLVASRMFCVISRRPSSDCSGHDVDVLLGVSVTTLSFPFARWILVVSSAVSRGSRPWLCALPSFGLLATVTASLEWAVRVMPAWPLPGPPKFIAWGQ